MPKREKPALIVVGNKTVIDRHRWNDEAMADFIQANGRGKWLPLPLLARVAYDRNDEINRKRAAKYLHKVRKVLAERKHVLLYDSDPKTRKILAVKLYDPSVPSDRYAAHERLEKMRVRSQLTAEQYEQAIALINSYQEEDELSTAALK